MDTVQVLLIVAGVVILLLTAALITVSVLLIQKTRSTTKAGNVKIINGVRYTTDKNEFKENGSAAITHLEDDFILERGVTFTARKGSKLVPGKYTILSAVEGVHSFNIRVGGLVREVRHASDIVLNDGDQICAVSHSAILR